MHDVTRELLARYDRLGPRYTSYPTAVEFNAGVDAAAYVRSLARANERAADPLSVYVHLPFCEERCAYCGCNVVVSPKYTPVEGYFAAFEAELDLWASRLPKRRQAIQLHWGGGTPTSRGGRPTRGGSSRRRPT